MYELNVQFTKVAQEEGGESLQDDCRPNRTHQRNATQRNPNQIKPNPSIHSL